MTSMAATRQQGKAKQKKATQAEATGDPQSGWCLAARVASSIGDCVVVRTWAGPGCGLSFPTLPWLCNVHFGGYLVSREAGSTSRSK